MPSVTLFLTRTPAHEFVFESTEELHLPKVPHPRGAPIAASVIGEGVNADSADNAARIKQFYMNPRQRSQFAINEQKALHARHPKVLAPTAQRDRLSGRWGLMGMLIGPEVFSAQWGAAGNVRQLPNLPYVPGRFLNPNRGQPISDTADRARRVLSFQGRSLSLQTDDQPALQNLTIYRSMERHRDEHGTGGYVALPQSLVPYEFKAETGNTVVRKLHSESKGRCLRVTHESAAIHGLSGRQEVILIHTAPSISWLVGCIAVRPIGDDLQYGDSLPNPPARCFSEIFTAVQAFGRGYVRVFVLP